MSYLEEWTESMDLSTVSDALATAVYMVANNAVSRLLGMQRA